MEYLAANVLKLTVEFAAMVTPGISFFIHFFSKKKISSWLVGTRWLFVRDLVCSLSGYCRVSVCLEENQMCGTHCKSQISRLGSRFLIAVCQAVNTEMLPIISSVVCLILKSTTEGIKGKCVFYWGGGPGLRRGGSLVNILQMKEGQTCFLRNREKVTVFRLAWKKLHHVG